MVAWWVLAAGISNRDYVFVLVLGAILIPGGVYTALNPTALQPPSQRLIRRLLPDRVVNALVRLLGVLFAVGWTVILAMTTLQKFG